MQPNAKNAAVMKTLPTESSTAISGDVLFKNTDPIKLKPQRSKIAMNTNRSDNSGLETKDNLKHPKLEYHHEVLKIEPNAFDLENLLIEAKEDSRQFIPEGYYEVVCVKAEKKKYFSTTKLYVTFKVVSPGEYCGLELFKAYNWYDPPRRGSDLFKDLSRLYGKRVTKKTKLPLTLFKNKILRVHVRAVTLDYKQFKLPEHLQYSVIDHLEEICTGPKYE